MKNNALWLTFTTLALTIHEILLVGSVTAIGKEPIYCSIANREEFSDYKFTFSLETDMPAGGYIEVTFPNQYRELLGIPLDPICNIRCERGKNFVKFFFDSGLAKNTVTTVEVKNIINPEYKGGVGNFEVRSKKGENILDENLIFGRIGMGDNPNQLISLLLEPDTVGGSLQAGEVSNYKIQFKTRSFIPQSSYFRITVPIDKGFKVNALPTCSFTSVNGYTIMGTPVCELKNGSVYVNGLGQNISKGTTMGIILEVTNPPYSQEMPAWRVEIIRDKTQFVYDWTKSLTADPILPGKINAISLSPTDGYVNLARTKRVLSTLQFTLTNPLESGSAIIIKIPTSFKLVANYFLNTPTTFYILSGLSDASSSTPLSMNYDDITTTLTITNFSPVVNPTVTPISIALHLIYPSSIGTTQSLSITSYKDYVSDTERGSKVDENSTDVTVTMTTLGSAISNSAILGSTVASGIGNTQVDFNFRAGSIISAGYTIEFQFESGLEVETAGGTCEIFDNGTTSFIPAGSCTSTGGLGGIVTIGTGTVTYNLGDSGSVRLGAWLKLPNIAKEYLVDIRVKDGGGTITESWTQSLTFTSTPMTGITFSTMPLEQDTYTILSLDFTIPFDTPISDDSTNPRSEIRIYFTGIGATFISKDIGYGSPNTVVEVSCRTLLGISPVTGNTITCKMFPGLNPYIQVKNYDPITSGTAIKLEFAKFKTPNGDFTVSLSVLKLENGLYQEISSGTGTITLNPSVSLTPVSSGITDPELQYTVDTRKVSKTFKLYFKIGNTVDINAGETMIVKLPFYDKGFIENPTSLVCLINGTPTTCTAFNKVDWIKIPITTTITTGAGIENYLEIQNLKWPRYSKANTEVTIDVVSGASASLQHYTYAPLTQAESNLFEKYDLSIDKTRRNEADVTYTFTFQTKNGLPEDSIITIDLPIQFTLLSTFPLIQIQYPDFTPYPGKTIETFYSSAQVTIQNINSYPALTDFRIILKGVRNPNTLLVLHNWKVSVLINNFLVDQQNKFAAFSLDDTYVPRTITVNRITALPDNGEVYADYYFSFTPRSALGSGGEIHIKFPSQYKILPSSPYCVISGAINTFSSCITDLNTIVMTTDTAYTSGTINIRINNIRNPTKGTTNAFEIETKYDSQIVDTIDEAIKKSNTLQIKEKPPKIQVGEFNYDPQNEGETSTYTFSFTPTIPLTKKMEILIKFPSTFDRTLGPKVECYPLQNLKGNVKCRVEEKQLYIYNFDAVTATSASPIKLDVRGIVNPNRLVNSDSGSISIAVLTSGSSTFLNYIAEAGVIETKSAPGWTLFNSISSTNTLSRLKSDYTLNMTVFDPIPAENSGGLIVIDIPLEFENVDQNLTCSTVNSTFGTPKCQLINNKIYVTGNQDPYQGNLILKIHSLRNPLAATTTDYFYIKTYDGYRKDIIERSFFNLDPYFQSYTFPGPVITIAGDNPITIEAGTQTIDLYAEVSMLSNLNLVLKPTTPTGMSFVPFELNLNIGEYKTKFRITVSENMAEGDYLIEWEILNDAIPNYYTPIKPTKVSVTKNKGVPITVQQLTNVPFGGHSIPCRVSVENAPDAGIEIHVAKKFDYKGIDLDKEILYFDAGDNFQDFQVTFTDTKSAAEENIATGQIEISLAGQNSAVYLLKEITLTFNVEQEDQTPPTIDSMTILSLTQHSAKIQVKTNDIVVLYFMIAYRGTSEPSLFEVKNQGPPQHLTTGSRYGYAFIGSSKQVDINIDGLTAGTDYVLYAYAEDRGGNYNGDPGYLYFTTTAQYRAAEMTLSFNKPFLSGPEKELAIRTVAFKLSLPYEKVLEKNFQPDSTTLRRNRILQTSILTLWIVPVNDNPNYPDPLTLAARINLQESKDYLKSKMADYDETYTSLITTYPIYSPFFANNPEIIDQTHESISVKVSFTHYGRIFMVAIPKEEDSITQPSPWQIWKGYSAENVEMAKASLDIFKPNSEFNIIAEGLKANTTYEVYLIGGTFHPDFPDLMNDANIVTLEADTLEAPTFGTDEMSRKLVLGIWLSLLIIILGTL